MAFPPSASGAAGASVVVPIHGAPEALERCLRSLFTHGDWSRHRLILVADGAQPAAVETQLAASDTRAGVELLRQPERRGYVAAANRGIAAAGGDVILLNSDTRVTAGWIENLHAAAHSAPDVASATPWSNAATICSLPRWLETNALPAGWDESRLAALIESVAPRAYPALPTGVGFCLYLKRSALDALGAFDEGAFGFGYGEESDWCARAARAGWRHVLDDATFIFHEGQASFGGDRDARVRAAHRVLRKRYPEYLRAVGKFIQDDPLRPLRERVLEGLRAGPPGGRGRPEAAPARVLHLVHGWPPWNHAGTELYAAWLARWQTRRRQVSVYARIADPQRRCGDAVELFDEGARVRLMVNNFTQRDPLARNALRDRRLERDFAAMLDDVRPDLVHVHHLAGHCATLPALARRRGIPVLFQLQDWWAPCARANLLDARRRLCSGPGLGKCARCLALTRRPPAALWNRLLYAYRGRLQRRALRNADAYLTGSEFLAASYLKLGWLRPDDPIYVRRYGVPLGATAPPAPAGARRAVTVPVRCGFVGSLLPHKGAHVAIAAFAGLDPARATLEIWGDSGADPDYSVELRRSAGAAVSFRAGFPESEKDAVLGSLDLLIVPSLGLESFGLVVHEAMARGVPVLASNRGALPEVLAAAPDLVKAITFDPESPEQLRALLERVVADPTLIDRWRAALPAVKDFAAHAEEVEQLYRRILEAPGRAAARSPAAASMR